MEMEFKKRLDSSREDAPVFVLDRTAVSAGGGGSTFLIGLPLNVIVTVLFSWKSKKKEGLVSASLVVPGSALLMLFAGRSLSRLEEK